MGIKLFSLAFKRKKDRKCSDSSSIASFTSGSKTLTAPASPPLPSPEALEKQLLREMCEAHIEIQPVYIGPYIKPGAVRDYSRPMRFINVGRDDITYYQDSCQTKKFLARPPPSCLSKAATAVVKAFKSPPPIGPRALDIEDFRLVQSIGKGAHGSVLLVQDRVTEKPFALKVVPRKDWNFHQYANVFEEQVVMKSLQGSRWCVPLRGSFQDMKNFYFLMDYHGKGDLGRRMVQRGGVSPSDAMRYAAELVVAVQDLQRRRVIHRDLKPDNILIDDDDHLVLADFGMAKSFGPTESDRPWEKLRLNRLRRWAVEDEYPELEGMEFTRTNCGTPGYVAPEVFTGLGMYSYEVDVWSIGVIIYAMLYDALPFGMCAVTQDTGELMERTCRLSLRFWDRQHVGKDARDLLRKMLEKDPAERITLEEVKKHPYFQSINWEQVERRECSEKKSKKVVVRRRKEDKVTELAAGRAYDVVPFPWFDYVSPSVHEYPRVKVKFVEKLIVDNPSPIEGAGIQGGATGEKVPVREERLGWFGRLKNWFKRKQVVEVKV